MPPSCTSFAGTFTENGFCRGRRRRMLRSYRPSGRSCNTIVPRRRRKGCRRRDCEAVHAVEGRLERGRHRRWPYFMARCRRGWWSARIDFEDAAAGQPRRGSNCRPLSKSMPKGCSISPASRGHCLFQYHRRRCTSLSARRCGMRTTNGDGQSNENSCLPLIIQFGRTSACGLALAWMRPARIQAALNGNWLDAMIAQEHCLRN